MHTWVIVLLIVLAVVIALLVTLTIVGNKLQKKQDSTNEQMRAAAQSVSLLVIDKKMMRLKDANLPDLVLQQTPKYLHKSKVPIVRAKVGPNIMNLMCDGKIFDLIPVKKEIKAQVSGIYIMDVKGIRGNLETVTEKKGFRARLRKAKSNNDAKIAELKKEQSKEKKK